ncbi:hypothetical protein EG328_005696 [Venturia inaequalis]|uniref:Chitin synthesis regulation, Congo red resistance, RCR protein n=1 Tax=Venturia inaequalis TaxID=5025 RepID=A0A8H3Z585_VENIN|nr:hypothetical protein EG328_005696 [Venturia inaequalis]KAE9994837.1 hypothetical protein EG327_000051 [Venturia inaequalis]RDI83819.1 Pre-mRNA-splicing factor [Venturia inaequalis]
MDHVNALNNLVRRRYCYYDSFNRYRCSSAWGNWGRWLVAGLIVFFFFAFIFCTCLTSRRRRAKGGTPIYGTGWMPGVGGPQANNNNYQPPPPQYGAQQNYNAGPGQESGYAPPPTAPKPAYDGGQQANYDLPQYNNGGAGANGSYYNPPAGPPPGQYK